MVEVPGRKSSTYRLLEYSSEEVHGLIQRIQGISWVELWPKRIKYLIARAGHLRSGQQEAEECQHLPSNHRSVDVPFPDANRYPDLVLDDYAISQLSGEPAA